MIRRRPGFTMIELVVVVAIIAVLISLLLPAVQSAREAARRVQCTNNLLQLGIALQSYESVHKVLPPGVVDRTGPVVETPTSYQFSWITQILPFLEQKNVGNHLDFRAGVYHVNNLTVRTVSMNTLLCPSQNFSRNSFQNFAAGAVGSQSGNLTGAAITNYAACHHDAEAPIDVKNNGVFFLNSHVRSEEIEDGLSHTIFLGEKNPPGDELGWASGTRATLRNAGTPINRTSLDPNDLNAFLAGFAQGPAKDDLDAPTDPGGPPPALPRQPPPALEPIPVGGFGSPHPGGSNFLFGDGSVHFVRLNINEQVYRRLGNRADGEPIGDDQF